MLSSGKTKQGSATSNSAPKLAVAIQYGLLVILALMPFHAFLSVWLGSIFGHEATIEAWKEIVLIILAALATVLVWREPARLARLRAPWVLATAAFAAIALIVTAAAHPPLAAAAFGAKTDLEFLLAAVVAAVVATPPFARRAVHAILASACLVVGFGLLQIFVLPTNFLTHFGYGPTTVAPFEYISGTTTPRYASTLGGPNQLGTYLIIPLILSLALAIKRRQWRWLVLTAGALVVLGATYSRGAWIGTAVALIIIAFTTIPNRLRRPAAIGLGCLGVTATLVLGGLIAHSPKLQTYLLHQTITNSDPTTSDAQHASSLRAGLHAVATNPLGHGLGTAGPATFHAGHLNIIEDYYLQVGYETGLLGLLAFLTLFMLILKAIWPQAPPFGPAATSALVGIGLVALVLPAWTDSSTALIAWILAGALAGLTKAKNHV